MEIHLAGNFPSGLKGIVGKVYSTIPVELEHLFCEKDKYLIAVQIYLAGGVTGNLSALERVYEYILGWLLFA